MVALRHPMWNEIPPAPFSKGLESAAPPEADEHFQEAVQRRITARGAVFLRVEEIGRFARGQRRHQVLRGQHRHGVARGFG